MSYIFTFFDCNWFRLLRGLYHKLQNKIYFNIFFFSFLFLLVSTLKILKHTKHSKAMISNTWKVHFSLCYTSQSFFTYFALPANGYLKVQKCCIYHNMLHISQYVTYTTICYIYHNMLRIPQYVAYTTTCCIYHNMLHIPQYVTYTTICYIYHNMLHIPQ